MTARLRALLLVLLGALGLAGLLRLGGESRRVLVGAATESPALGQDMPDSSRGLVLIAAVRAAWDAEVLATYGLPALPVLAPEALPAAALARDAVVLVSNEPLPDAARIALLQHVQGGGALLELGPLPSVCGSTLGRSLPGPFALEPPLAPVRWLGEIRSSDPEPCADTACPRADLFARTQQHSDAPIALSVERSLGAGHCRRWLGDLTGVLQRMRQGDPARVPREPATPFKPSLLFAGQIEPADLDVPGADRLGLLLLAQLAGARHRLAFIDVLPAGFRSVLIYTADQDFVPGAGVELQSASLTGHGLTMLLTAADIGSAPDIVFPEGDPSFIDLERAQALGERGHEIGLHPNLVDVPAGDYAGVVSGYARKFSEHFGVKAELVRNHHLRWSGYVTMAEYQARAGLRMNLDYVSLEPESDVAQPWSGFMTGSGLASYFADEQLRLIPIFQQATQLDDHSFIEADRAGKLSAALDAIAARSRKLLDSAVREHTALTVLQHPAWWHATHAAWQDVLLREAAARRVPIWSAGHWLQFTEARRRARIALVQGGVDVWLDSDALGVTVPGVLPVRIDGAAAEPAARPSFAGRTWSVYRPGPGRHELRW